MRGIEDLLHAAGAYSNDPQGALRAVRALQVELERLTGESDLVQLENDGSSDAAAWREVIKALRGTPDGGQDHLHINLLRRAVAGYEERFGLGTGDFAVKTFLAQALIASGAFGDAARTIQDIIEGDYGLESLPIHIRRFATDLETRRAVSAAVGELGLTLDLTDEAFDLVTAVAAIDDTFMGQDAGAWTAVGQWASALAAKYRADLTIPAATYVNAAIKALSHVDPASAVDLIEHCVEGGWPLPHSGTLHQVVLGIRFLVGLNTEEAVELLARLRRAGVLEDSHLTSRLAGGYNPVAAASYATAVLAAGWTSEDLRDPSLRAHLRLFHLWSEGLKSPTIRPLALDRLAQHGREVLPTFEPKKLGYIGLTLASLEPADLENAVTSPGLVELPRCAGMGRLVAEVLAGVVRRDIGGSTRNAVMAWAVSLDESVSVVTMKRAAADAADSEEVARAIQDSALVTQLLARESPDRMYLSASRAFDLATVLDIEARLRVDEGTIEDITIDDIASLLLISVGPDPLDDAVTRDWKFGLRVANPQAILQHLSALVAGRRLHNTVHNKQLVAALLPDQLLLPWMQQVAYAERERHETRHAAVEANLGALLRVDDDRFGILSALRAPRKFDLLRAAGEIYKQGHYPRVRELLDYLRAQGDFHETSFLVECLLTATRRETRPETWRKVCRTYLMADPGPRPGPGSSARDQERWGRRDRAWLKRMSAGIWTAVTVGALTNSVRSGQELLLDAVESLRTATWLPEVDRAFSAGELQRILMSMPRTDPYYRAETSWASLMSQDDVRADPVVRFQRFLELLGVAHAQADALELAVSDDPDVPSLARTWNVWAGAEVPTHVMLRWDASHEDRNAVTHDDEVDDEVMARVSILADAISSLFYHDMQNVTIPLAQVRQRLDALPDGVVPESVRDRVRRAHGHAKDMVHVMRQLRRSDVGGPYDLRDVLAEFVAPGDVTWRLSQDVGTSIPRSLLVFALSELRSNARGHAGSDRLLVDVSYDPNQGRYGSVEIVVADEGEGIPADLVNEAFQITTTSNPDNKRDRALITLHHALTASDARLVVNERDGRLWPVIKAPATRPRAHQARQPTAEDNDT